MMKRTIKLKLPIAPEKILPTIIAYTRAYNFVCAVGWNDKDFNGVSLHHKTYHKIRKYLPSGLASSARVKATETLKSVKTKLSKNINVSCPKSKLVSIRCDSNCYNFWKGKNKLSLLLISGREKFSINVPKYFDKYLDWQRKSAELIIKNKKVFMHICFERPAPIFTLQPKLFVGLDRGINNIAVLSTNKFYSGLKMKSISSKYKKLRSSLQSNGSKSAKRHLKKISEKEKRFKRNYIHIVTKQIINSLPQRSVIVLENLKNIRNAKNINKKVHEWGFDLFKKFLEYKAEEKGIKIAYVDARYTSQKCSACGHISKNNRKKNIFKCKKCDLMLNADLNASRNIKQNYLKTISF